MSEIKRFEDLYAWQKARELSKAIYECSGAGKFNKDFLRILGLTSETANLIGGMVRYLLKSSFTGKKYK